MTRLDSATDAELVRRAAGGERDAFAAIYERYRGLVYRFARLMSGSETLAEDVTQEVFVTFMRNLSRYERDRAELPTYLYGVARNVTRNQLRRNRRFVAMQPALDHTPCASSDPLVMAAHAQRLSRLRQLILALPSRYREVVILCDVHGLSYAESARIVRIPVGTIRSRLNRGRQMIAARMRDSDRSRLACGAARVERCVV
jgi:RNA polymerase sigma-70 factor (ECF subfamily)